MVAIIYWQYSSLWRPFSYNWAVHNSSLSEDYSSMLSLRKSCMETLSPDKLSLLLFSRKSIQLKTLSACVLMAETHKYFLTSLQVLGIVVFLASSNPRDPGPPQELALFCTCKQTIINSKYWVCQSMIWFCHWVVGTKKVKVGPKKAVQRLQIFAISFFTVEWVPISGLPIIWRFSC